MLSAVSGEADGEGAWPPNQERPVALDVVGGQGQLELRESRQDHLEGDPTFEPGERRPYAEVVAEAEGQVVGRWAIDVEAVGVLEVRFVAVRGGEEYATWGGKGNWYLVDPWELRRAIVVEARPKAAHPLYSRRVVYIDVQTGVSLYALAYDHEGNHKRTFLMVYRHPDFNPWNNDEWFAQVAAQASIDYQLERANNFQVHKVLHNRPMVASRFDVMTLLLKGK